jgi:hypothetical protein
MRPRCSQRSTASLVASTERRKPQRVLGELGRERGSAASRRGPRSLVQHRGHLAVRSIRGQREVPRPDKRVVHGVGDSPVDTLPVVCEVCVEHRREQRVTETKRAVLVFDHIRRDGGIERARVDACALE